MNANYLAIVLWVGSLIVQFIAYVILAAKQRGRDEMKFAKIAELELENGEMRDKVRSLELQMENVSTYLEAKNGIKFRRS